LLHPTHNVPSFSVSMIPKNASLSTTRAWRSRGWEESLLLFVELLVIYLPRRGICCWCRCSCGKSRRRRSTLTIPGRKWVINAVWENMHEQGAVLYEWDLGRGDVCLVGGEYWQWKERDCAKGREELQYLFVFFLFNILYCLLIHSFASIFIHFHLLCSNEQRGSQQLLEVIHIIRCFAQAD
jgi:hypothetical protein